MIFFVCIHITPRLMMCKTVQATPQAGHSAGLESSSSSQRASGLKGAARRDLEVNGSAAGKKVVCGNELERLFTQPTTQDTSMVSENFALYKCIYTRKYASVLRVVNETIIFSVVRFIFFVAVTINSISGGKYLA